MTEVDAENLRTDQLRHAEEIETAITFEIADIENNILPEHQRGRDKAVGTLISRSRQFLGLVTASSRLSPPCAMSASTSRNARMVMLDDDLCRMIGSNQLSGAGRSGAATPPMKSSSPTGSGPSR